MSDNIDIMQEILINDILHNLKRKTYLVSDLKDLRVIPESIEYLSELEELYIRNCYNVRALPKGIGYLQGLKVLELNRLRLRALPSSFGALHNLEQLTVNGYALPNTMNWKALADLKQLSYLNLDVSLERIKKLPEAIKSLQNLKHLSICNNKLEDLPMWLADLPKLEILDCGGNYFMDIPKVISKIKSLKHLSISARLANQTPAGLADLDPTVKLSITHKSIQMYTKPRAIEQFWKRNKQMNFSRKEKLFILELIRQKSIDSSISNTNLYAVLNCGVRDLLTQALSLLEQRIQAKEIGKEQPFQKGQAILFNGKLNTSTNRLKNRLKELGFQTVSKLNSKVKHVILGKAPKINTYEDIADCQLWTETLLMEQINQLEKPYLLTQEGEEQINSVENIRALLMSQNEDNVLLGIELLENGGCPKELFTTVFLVYKCKSTAVTRKAILRLMGQYASSDYIDALKKRSDITNANVYEETHCKNLEYYQQKADLDLKELCFYLWNHYKLGVLFSLKYLTSADKLSYLENMMLDQELNLKFRQLTELPQELSQLDHLLTLNIAANPITKVPEVLFRLPNLETLELAFNPFCDGEILKKIVEIPTLKRLYIDSITMNIKKEELPSKAFQKQNNCKIIEQTTQNELPHNRDRKRRFAPK
ncbi:MAG: leucine-rich repeat domain-containing protein [Saprospiraceae bacterium]|nr:leucine-rich repeat domain-containing protein [Saprospiraceae bacterium]